MRRPRRGRGRQGLTAAQRGAAREARPAAQRQRSVSAGLKRRAAGLLRGARLASAPFFRTTSSSRPFRASSIHRSLAPAALSASTPSAPPFLSRLSALHTCEPEPLAGERSCPRDACAPSRHARLDGRSPQPQVSPRLAISPPRSCPLPSSPLPSCCLFNTQRPQCACGCGKSSREQPALSRAGACPIHIMPGRGHPHARHKKRHPHSFSCSSSCRSGRVYRTVLQSDQLFILRQTRPSATRVTGSRQHSVELRVTVESQGLWAERKVVKRAKAKRQDVTVVVVQVFYRRDGWEGSAAW